MRQELIFILVLLILIPVAGAVSISNTTTQSTITWVWTDTPSGISNLTIDGYEVCGVSPSLTTFLLSSLDPSSTHQINITYLGTNTLQSTTTLNATGGSGGSGESQDILGGLIWGAVGAIVISVFLLRRRTK